MFESLSGHRIVLMTDPLVSDQQAVLREVYLLMLEYAIKSPLYKPGSLLNTEAFLKHVDDLIKSLPYFN